MGNDAARLFELLVQYLCVEHIDYAVDLGLQGIPSPHNGLVVTTFHSICNLSRAVMLSEPNVSQT